MNATVAGVASGDNAPVPALTEYIVIRLLLYDVTYAHLLSGEIASWIGSLPVATVAGVRGVSAPVVTSTENCETVEGERLTT